MESGGCRWSILNKWKLLFWIVSDWLQELLHRRLLSISVSHLPLYLPHMHVLSSHAPFSFMSSEFGVPCRLFEFSLLSPARPSLHHTTALSPLLFASISPAGWVLPLQRVAPHELCISLSQWGGILLQFLTIWGDRWVSFKCAPLCNKKKKLKAFTNIKDGSTERKHFAALIVIFLHE